jgi:hypothetical protein
MAWHSLSALLLVFVWPFLVFSIVVLDLFVDFARSRQQETAASRKFGCAIRAEINASVEK